MQNEHFTLSPMQNYSPPTYPSRAENPMAVLKKVPVRWAKHAAILACIGALSLGALTGCTAQGIQAPTPYDDSIHGVTVADPQDGNPYVENVRTFDVVVRTHMGGSAAGPFYVAYLTEQEALGIIRSRLYQAGIAFDNLVSKRPLLVFLPEPGPDPPSQRLRSFDRYFSVATPVHSLISSRTVFSSIGVA